VRPDRGEGPKSDPQQTFVAGRVYSSIISMRSNIGMLTAIHLGTEFRITDHCALARLRLRPFGQDKEFRVLDSCKLRGKLILVLGHEFYCLSQGIAERRDANPIRPAFRLWEPFLVNPTTQPHKIVPRRGRSGVAPFQRRASLRSDNG
jgi:hypothetical protein